MRAFLFDIDGTLLDTERIYVKAWQAAALRLGYCLPDDLMLRTRAIDPKIASRMMEEEVGGGFSYEAVRRVRTEIGEAMVEADGHLLKPGTEALLKALRDAEVPLAAVTSTGMQQTARHLELAGIAELIPVRVTGDMVARGKPHPDIFLQAASLLDVDPQDCYAVEDSAAGIKASVAAGMKPILVPDLAIVDDATRRMAFRVVRSLEEVLQALPELLG